MLLDKSVIKQWIQEGSKPIKANLSFLREDKFIEKFTSTYNDSNAKRSEAKLSNLTSKEKYKVNCDFERYWGLYYKKKYGTLTENQTAWTGWLGEHLFQEYCNKRKYNYCCRPKTTAGSERRAFKYLKLKILYLCEIIHDFFKRYAFGSEAFKKKMPNLLIRQLHQRTVVKATM